MLQSTKGSALAAGSVYGDAAHHREALFGALAADLRWPLPEGMDDHQLEQLLFPPSVPSGTPRPTQRTIELFAAEVLPALRQLGTPERGHDDAA